MSATTRQVTHDEAHAIASRLIAGSFRRNGECLPDDKRPRISAPARPDRDDDLLICAYIQQQQDNASGLLEALREVVDAVAITEMGEVCQKLDFAKARAAIAKATGGT